jgi:hypothetical protein
MDKNALIQLLQTNYQHFIECLTNLSDIEFDLEKNGKWTAGQHLEHLNLSVKPLLMAYSLPSFIPRLWFGKANRPSRSFEDLVKKYQEKLANGGRATGAYIPKKVTINQKTDLINKLQKQINSLSQKVAQFTENQLDTLILPHPLIGKITFREMLYFTAYHVQHHEELIKKNLAP